jgi:hypothetical protein
MHTTQTKFLINLLERGNNVSIISGVLKVEDENGKVVSEEWIKTNSDILLQGLSKLVLIPIFKCVKHSVGEYGEKNSPGLCLQFVNVMTDEDSYVVFNVDNKRKRKTAYGEKGSRLPKGQFNVGVRSKLSKFWIQNNLPKPRRPSSFHDVIGKMKGRYITGTVLPNNRFEDKRIPLINFTNEEVYDYYQQKMVSNTQAKPKQVPSNNQAMNPSNRIEADHIEHNAERNRTTCYSNYGISKQGGALLREGKALNPKLSKPEEQTNDEWFDDWDNA